MKTRDDKLKELAPTGAQPDLAALREDYDWCVARRDNSMFARQKINYETRHCIWPGQTADGRKWNPTSGAKDVWPWPGASDARVHLVDNYIIEDVASLMTIWRRNKIICTPTESNDQRTATQQTHLLRWLVYTQMRELPEEARLAANLLTERGAFVPYTCWVREMRLTYDEVDVDAVATRAQSAAQQLAIHQMTGQMPGEWTELQALGAVELAANLLTGEEGRLTELFQEWFPDVTPARCRKAVRDLREKGHARFVRPYVFKNRPCVWALAPNEDVFLPEDAPTIAQAQGIHYRELLTEAALRERVVGSNYDQGFVDEVIERMRGVVTNEFENRLNLRVRRQTGAGLGGRTSTERLFEVIHSYRQLADGEGVLGIYYTCWHPGLVANSSRRQTETTCAYHGLLNYDHGEYPFGLVQRERKDRILANARGYGEIASTWQNQIKSEWDQRIDAGSLNTNPPMRHPPGRPPEQWGPGTKLGARDGDYGFLEGPKLTPHSREIIMDVKEHADQYFGRQLPGGRNVVGAQAIQQDLADVWMGGWGGVYTQVLQLEQQFGPDEIYYRVIGTDKARPLHATREEIQGQFDVQISFNTKLLDAEYVKTVFEFIDHALQWDVGARIDRDEIVQFGFDVIDPNLGERVLKPGEEASAAEAEDERTVLAKMATGLATDVKPGQAWKLRAETLEASIQKSQEMMRRFQNDPGFRAMVQERLKQLNHQVQQYTVNAQTGRLGGKPAMTQGGGGGEPELVDMQGMQGMQGGGGEMKGGAYQ